jgi:orotate phosphoribosyltransferase
MSTASVMTVSDSARSRLRDGLNRHALKKGRFVLASGAVSDYYVNVKEICLRGEYLRLVGELLWRMIKDSGANAVGGMTLGADPIVAAVTIAAADDGFDCPALIVRKETKEHGTARQIEGPFDPTMRVAVVEDVTTTGHSAMKAAEAILAAGATVVGVYSVLNRAAGADALFAERGWPFQAIFTTADLDL